MLRFHCYVFAILLSSSAVTPEKKKCSDYSWRSDFGFPGKNLFLILKEITERIFEGVLGRIPGWIPGRISKGIEESFEGYSKIKPYK